ncbi:hypothetical protein KSB_69730 [Ktedonobacter robiniae]|uniref:Uncharacterized protein n=1 Tax=Ktedonobacter robiniae TaxID=2778365 RepID=A0ABQ3V0F0_9CHLR|nr:hypothetical protein KSB_69730 [Ktedonobacter robiniae]
MVVLKKGRKKDRKKAVNKNKIDYSNFKQMRAWGDDLRLGMACHMIFYDVW